ncbi:NAD-dependent epimerase/dehydratase family protein [Streptomyces sp. A30]|uniref:NAD-dependent epimerase/dehydratase family protein n=1 Tax=Streptomyces sp. A30 TaxID=2789273 RepID=UPI003980DCE8
MTPHVVILGATGFIGTAVTRELARRPVRLTTVSRRPLPAPAPAVADVRPLAADLAHADAVAEAVEGADAVLNLVAYNGEAGTWRVAHDDVAAERINTGVARGIDAAFRAAKPGAGRPVVVVAGSVSQARPAAPPRLDGTEADAPRGAYDTQKLESERILKAATRAGVLRGVALRLPTLFARGEPTADLDRGVISAMVRRAIAGEPLTMWHDGTVRRDLLCVDDAARAMVAAVAHAGELAGRHWLLGTGRSRPLGEVFGAIARTVSEYTGRPPVPVVSVPAPEHAQHCDFESVEVDAGAFRSATGWRPEVSFESALRATVASLVKNQTIMRRQ